MRTKSQKRVDRIILMCEKNIDIDDFETKYEYQIALGNDICNCHIELFKRKTNDRR